MLRTQQNNHYIKTEYTMLWGMHTKLELSPEILNI